MAFLVVIISALLCTGLTALLGGRYRPASLLGSSRDVAVACFVTAIALSALGLLAAKAGLY